MIRGCHTKPIGKETVTQKDTTKKDPEGVLLLSELATAWKEPKKREKGDGSISLKRESVCTSV